MKPDPTPSEPMAPDCATPPGDMPRPFRSRSRLAGAALVSALAPALVSAFALASALAFAGLAAAEDRAADPPKGCEGVELDAVVARVQARYDGIRDFEASFEQTTHSVMMGGAGLGDATPTTGRVQIAKPGRMRWHYEKPRESLVMSDGDTLWIYDVEAREVTRARVTSGYLAGAALQFLLGEGAIVDAFDIRLLGCTEGVARLELLPKEDASYEKLAMSVDAQSVVVGTTIHDLFGNVTELRFSEMRFDLEPPTERFRWQVVEGVRVVDLVPVPGG